jgi:dTDP-glucose pyrophosphorylase
LKRLDILASDAILFVVDESDILLGSLTDGDVRRGFLRGMGVNDDVDSFVERSPKFIRKGAYSIMDIICYRREQFRVIPVVDKDFRVVNIINFHYFKSYLPVDAVIMAGGRGKRLSPLTDNTPKPLLKVGAKTIIEHSLDRLISFGIEDFWVSIQYLGEQIENYLGTNGRENVCIRYVKEPRPLGTIGSLSLIGSFNNDYILVTNSDLLTNIDYEDFFCNFLESEAVISIATIPYVVNVPYAILETREDTVMSFKEKPTYTYYANAGIYLIKKELIEMIPYEKFFDATDLIDECIKKGLKINSYTLTGYWLDIGNPDDFYKAQRDINHIIF